MISNILLFLETTILPIGGIGVFIAAFLEEVIAPIPSAAVLFVSGFLFLSEFSLSDPQFWITYIFTIIIPAALGMTIGSLLVYGIFYYSGRIAIEKFGKYFGISLAHLEKIESKLGKSRWDEVALIAFRTLPMVPNVAVSAAFGTLRMPLSHYIPCTFIGSALRAAILVLFGWQAGELYYRYADIISHFERYVLVGIILLVFCYLLYRLAKINRK